MSRIAQYKPLLLTTTMRNPERLKDFLGVLKAYAGRVLDDALATEVSGEIIRIGLYKPRRIQKRARRKINDGEPLTDSEVSRILRDNPQNHKEAGFSWGWPSRFDTWFKIAKELGFVFYKPGEKIKFSEPGLMLADCKDSRVEQQAFLNAFVKYRANNPFRRVLNDNVPLILLLQVIEKINSDKDLGDSGISKMELPLLLYWKDGDSEALYRRIKGIRKEFGYSPSWEVIVDICRDEIMEGRDVRRDEKSIMMDYPDDFIRKMRLTGLISLRGGGRFLDINRNEQAKVSYVLDNYADQEEYTSEEEYFKYASAIDKELFSLETKLVSVSQREEFLVKWLDVYSWDTIRAELLTLSRRRLTSDEMLKYLPNSVRLEFLAALAVKSRFPDVQVIPNYPVDDEGIPTSTAGGQGDTGDIECSEGEYGILIEVTMAEGRAQTVMEVGPIKRHLEKIREKSEQSMCYFVAPSVHPDTLFHFDYLRDRDGLLVLSKNIKEFLEHIENANILYVSG